MYFPYLRGKQYELLALKDFSQMSPNNAKIIPVIEPVKSQVNGLNSALEALRDNAMRFAVILNPKDGDFKKDRDNDIFPKLNTLQEDRESWIPAYFYKGYPDLLLSHAENHNFRHFMVVFPDGVNIHNQEIARLLADEKVEYVAIICAKNMPAGSYYSLLCLQNNNTTESEDSEERDLEINNEMYSYKEQADESVNLAVVKAKDNCDLFFQIVTLKAEDNLPQPLSSGLYTLHYYNQNLKCHQSARSGFQSARLMLRIKREGKFKANISSYEPECFSPNSQLAVKPDGSALDTLAYSYLTNSDAYVDKQKVDEENLFDTTQVPVVVGNNLTTIGAIKTGESSASEYLQPASFILACNDDKVYRLGYIVAIKAREISFDRETGEYKKGGYVRKVMKLVAIAKDHDADSSNYSDRLIFEADFDKDKEYNDFELQLYWQNQMITKSPISDLVYEKREELMGALKDVVISLVHKI